MKSELGQALEDCVPCKVKWKHELAIEKNACLPYTLDST